MLLWWADIFTLSGVVISNSWQNIIFWFHLGTPTKILIRLVPNCTFKNGINMVLSHVLQFLSKSKEKRHAENFHFCQNQYFSRLWNKRSLVLWPETYWLTSMSLFAASSCRRWTPKPGTNPIQQQKYLFSKCGKISTPWMPTMAKTWAVCYILLNIILRDDFSFHNNNHGQQHLPKCAWLPHLPIQPTDIPCCNKIEKTSYPLTKFPPNPNCNIDNIILRLFYVPFSLMTVAPVAAALAAEETQALTTPPSTKLTSLAAECMRQSSGWRCTCNGKRQSSCQSFIFWSPQWWHSVQLYIPTLWFF